MNGFTEIFVGSAAGLLGIAMMFRTILGYLARLNASLARIEEHLGIGDGAQEDAAQ